LPPLDSAMTSGGGRGPPVVGAHTCLQLHRIFIHKSYKKLHLTNTVILPI